MNENRCIVMWREMQYLVVRTSVPPTNNTLLILVPPTSENALEIITIMNPDKMEENECTFMPEYNEIAEQLLKMEVIKETEETLEGMPLRELLMNEDNTQLIPIYKINLNRVENVPELVEHFPQNLLKKYTECCKLNEDLNEINTSAKTMNSQSLAALAKTIQMQSPIALAKIPQTQSPRATALAKIPQMQSLRATAQENLTQR